jgi:hypothetical protein
MYQGLNDKQVEQRIKEGSVDAPLLKRKERLEW